MILTDKIRNMSDGEKIVYFLKKVVENGHNRNSEELLQEVSKIMQGVPVDQVLEKFNLEGEFMKNLDSVTKPAMLRIKLDKDSYIDLDITDIDKKKFVHPEPIDPIPITPMLSPEELEDIKKIHE
jgi:hypothetical protein